MVIFKREVPVRYEVDVMVAGGGPAGLAAAITAGRRGRKVFLAEGHSCFGGMGTAGLIPAFMQFTNGVDFLAGGVGREVYDRVRVQGNPEPHTIQVEMLKRIYDQMVVESGIEFSLLTQMIAVEKNPDRVTHVILAGKSELYAVKAKVFIDCTGDGDLAAWAGAPFEKGDPQGNMMPGTLCSLWADVDWEVGREVLQASKLEDAFKDKVFTVEDRHHSGMWRVGEHLGGANISHAFGVDGTDERSLTRHVIESRKILPEYERYYREYLKGFENTRLVISGSLMGIRETRRIMGEYVLNLEDFKKRASFEDEIGRYSYPVDIHSSSPSKGDYDKFLKEYHTFRYGEGESYGIPYRALIPRDLTNVLVAGRCISTDRSMQGSVRVMPGCFITGQAAGMAAALAVERGTEVRGVDIQELQRALKAIGGYLPNCKTA